MMRTDFDYYEAADDCDVQRGWKSPYVQAFLDPSPPLGCSPTHPPPTSPLAGPASSSLLSLGRPGGMVGPSPLARRKSEGAGSGRREVYIVSLQSEGQRGGKERQRGRERQGAREREVRLIVARANTTG